MLKNVPLVLVFIFISYCAFSADRYWISSSSSTWNNTANWSTTSGGASGASVPGSSDIVYFDANGTGTCTLDINATVDALSISAAIINTSTYVFTISGTNNSTFSGGTINGNNTFIIHPTGTARATFSGTIFNPAVDVIAPRILLSGSTFNSTSSFEKTGANTDNGAGGNTFVGNSIIKNSGSGDFQLGNGGDDIFSANLNVINTGTSSTYIAYSNSTTSIGGDLSIENINTGVSIGVSYNGSSSVSISGNFSATNNSSVSSNLHIANYGIMTIGGTFDIINDGTDKSTIHIARQSSSNITIDGVATITNNEFDSTKKIYLGRNGDITFNDALLST